MAITKVSRGLLSTGVSDSSDATAISITSDEKVGLGVTAPENYTFGTPLAISAPSGANSGLTIVSATNSNGTIAMADGTSGSEAYKGYLQYSHTSDAMFIGAGGSAIARFDSDGIKFGSDSAAANALDDYEEGTWTPAISSGGVTYTIQVGKYTKIGNVVTVSFHIDINTNSNGSSTTFFITGLPFTSSASPSGIYWQSATLHCNLWSNSSIPDNGLVAGNTNTMSLYILSGTSASLPTHGSLGGGNILATITYKTDA